MRKDYSVDVGSKPAQSLSVGIGFVVHKVEVLVELLSEYLFCEVGGSVFVGLACDVFQEVGYHIFQLVEGLLSLSRTLHQVYELLPDLTILFLCLPLQPFYLLILLRNLPLLLCDFRLLL